MGDVDIQISSQEGMTACTNPYTNAKRPRTIDSTALPDRAVENMEAGLFFLVTGRER